MVRKAELRDVKAMMQLLLQVDNVHNQIRPDLFKGDTTKYTEQQLADILNEPSSPIFVYEDADGRVLGHAFCQVSQFSGHHLLQDVKTLYIDDICVDEKFRGHHVGQDLYLYVRDYARSIGCYNITLNVWEGNDAALAFYRRMGMKVQKTGMESLL